MVQMSSKMRSYLSPKWESEVRKVEVEQEAVYNLPDFWEDTALSKKGIRATDINVQLPVSELVQRTLCWQEGQRMSFTFRPWLQRIYDSEYESRGIDDRGRPSRPRRFTLLKTARQCEKSTSLGNKSLTYSAFIDGVTTLYVSPGGKNTEEFADKRVTQVMQASPVMSAWLGKQFVKNKYAKRFENSSRIVLRSAYLDAGRVRGIPADILLLDEFQDILPNVVPVVVACLNNSNLPRGPIRVYAGTPLTTDNIIERTWVRNSTMNTWMMKCSRCNTYNEPGPKQVTRHGLCCRKCGKPLDVLGGQWVRMNEREDVTFEGYHLSRAMMPYTMVANLDRFEEKWEGFYKDVNDPNVDEAAIMNEIFGLSFDSGKKPLSRDELIACTDPYLRMRRVLPDAIVNDPGWPIFMGVDWGEGTENGAYTVVTLGYYNADHQFVVAYCHRYTGKEANPRFVKKDIAALIELNKVNLVFCDAGGGWGMIDSIRDSVDNGLERIIPVRYSANQGQVLAYDEKAHQFVVHRTRWMAKMFNFYLRRKMILPRWSEFQEPYGEDILNIHVERSRRLGQMIYGHTGTDDTFHSILYAKTAAMFMYEELSEFINA